MYRLVQPKSRCRQGFGKSVVTCNFGFAAGEGIGPCSDLLHNNKLRVNRFYFLFLVKCLKSWPCKTVWQWILYTLSVRNPAQPTHRMKKIMCSSGSSLQDRLLYINPFPALPVDYCDNYILFFFFCGLVVQGCVLLTDRVYSLSGSLSLPTFQKEF